MDNQSAIVGLRQLVQQVKDERKSHFWIGDTNSPTTGTLTVSGGSLMGDRTPRNVNEDIKQLQESLQETQNVVSIQRDMLDTCYREMKDLRNELTQLRERVAKNDQDIYDSNITFSSLKAVIDDLVDKLSEGVIVLD